jgi:glycosyltransferase involved in cell wall biosynthesis
MGDKTAKETIEVDVIIPVHNAAATIQAAVESSLYQEWPADSDCFCDTKTDETSINNFYYPELALSKNYSIFVTVCCYDDGSTDNSLAILKRLQIEHSTKALGNSKRIIGSRLLVKSSADGTGTARGAGYARNRAIEMNNPPLHHQRMNADQTTSPTRTKFLCLLDSDDTMHQHRVALQTLYLMQLDPATRNRTLLGCNFVRDPPDSTWHYSQWANSLTDERLLLERFREITILQPTWFLPYSVWARVGGYVEAPPPVDSNEPVTSVLQQRQKALADSFDDSDTPCCLIHPRFDTPTSLRLAEDLRFFHAHLCHHGTIRLLRSKTPLVHYRYFGDETSQSFRTSRKLLLQLRVLAFEKGVLRREWQDYQGKFIVWGAGRDGKDFYKALDPKYQLNIYCFVDVDDKKLLAGAYVPPKEDGRITRKIPIIHFSSLIPNPKIRQCIQTAWRRDGGANDAAHGRIDKSKDDSEIGPQKKKKPKLHNSVGGSQLLDRGLDQDLLQTLPVVVCVAMYRTNGVLERNVASIDRTEGVNLWHFS